MSKTTKHSQCTQVQEELHIKHRKALSKSDDRTHVPKAYDYRWDHVSNTAWHYLKEVMMWDIQLVQTNKHNAHFFPREIFLAHDLLVSSRHHLFSLFNNVEPFTLTGSLKILEYLRWTGTVFSMNLFHAKLPCQPWNQRCSWNPFWTMCPALPNLHMICPLSFLYLYDQHIPSKCLLCTLLCLCHDSTLFRPTHISTLNF